MSRQILIFAPAALLAALPAIAAEPVRPSSSPAQVAQTALAPAQSGAAKPAQSLYDRVGGIFAIAGVVDRFSDAIIKNPKLNQNPALVAWNRDEAPNRLPGLKVMRTLWIASVAGGPFQYTGKPLADAHPRFKLTEAEFKEVGAEIVRALEHFKVPQKEQQELVKAYNASMADVVTETP